MKYTKEELEKWVKESLYLSDMIRKMGMTPNSGNNRYLSKRVKFFDIDTSHWLNNSEKSKRFNNADKKKKSAKEVLVVYVTSKPVIKMLRRAMFELGIEHKCVECGIGPEYNNKELVLQVDHINGNNLDNRLENLRFLCPNCHSQTSNFMVKNAKLEKHHPKKYKCLDCDNLIWFSSKRCKECSYKFRKGNMPTKETLEKLVWEKPSTKIAKEYGVADTLINKWCKFYGINKPPRGYWQKISKK